LIEGRQGDEQEKVYGRADHGEAGVADVALVALAQLAFGQRKPTGCGGMEEVQEGLVSQTFLDTKPR